MQVIASDQELSEEEADIPLFPQKRSIDTKTTSRSAVSDAGSQHTTCRWVVTEAISQQAISSLEKTLANLVVSQIEDRSYIRRICQALLKLYH